MHRQAIPKAAVIPEDPQRPGHRPADDRLERLDGSLFFHGWHHHHLETSEVAISAEDALRPDPSRGLSGLPEPEWHNKHRIYPKLELDSMH